MRWKASETEEMRYPDNRDIPWKKWFAWRPVEMYTFEGPIFIWLEVIERRKQYNRGSRPLVDDNYEWEYRYVL